MHFVLHGALHLEEEVEHVRTHLVAHIFDRKYDIDLGDARMPPTAYSPPLAPPPPEREPPPNSVWLSSAPLGGSVGGAGVGVVAVGDSVGLVLVLIVPAAWTSGK